jgi:hypothetical protein
MHDYNNPSEDFIRLMLNHPRSRENHVMTEPYNIGGSVLSRLYSHLAIGYAISEVAERPSLYEL